MKLDKLEQRTLYREIVSSYFIFTFLDFLKDNNIMEIEKIKDFGYFLVYNQLEKEQDITDDEVKKYIEDYLINEQCEDMVDEYIKQGFFNIENIRKEILINNIRNHFTSLNTMLKDKLLKFLYEVFRNE